MELIALSRFAGNFTGSDSCLTEALKWVLVERAQIFGSLFRIGIPVTANGWVGDCSRDDSGATPTCGTIRLANTYAD